jgi:hypothetical protein
MSALRTRGVVRSVLLASALIAVGVGGTAVAGALIDSSDVKNNSLKGIDVKNKSLTKKDFRGSVRGPRGPVGPAGARGATGPAGATGPSGVAGGAVVARSVTFDAASAQDTLVAQCNPGEIATGGGGGWTNNNEDVAMENSKPWNGTQGAGGPTPNGTAATGWMVHMVAPKDTSMTVYALCQAP